MPKKSYPSLGSIIWKKKKKNLIARVVLNDNFAWLGHLRLADVKIFEVLQKNIS